MSEACLQEFRRPSIVKTRDLRVPTQYAVALDNEYQEFAFNEERCLLNRGEWRAKVFQVNERAALDLEIGTGNGVHFVHHCKTFPERFLVGIELKYKPLIQAIRGMLKAGSQNGRICRAHAFNLDLIFADQEINDIFIHFPDPWTSPRKPKNRLVTPRMVEVYSRLQKLGGKLELKTDSADFFLWALKCFHESNYQLLFESRDWRSDTRSTQTPMTCFEKIFVRQKLPIYYAKWEKVLA